MTDDPRELQARLADATGRLLGTAAGITDGQAAEPSLLPGWSRGHVLTHLARNADGLRNLLIWARTGVVTPQYPSQQARDDAIEAGAARPAGDLLADLHQSAAGFRAEAAAMPPAAWQVSVHGVRGRGHPAWYTLTRRLGEVEIHHVDLAAGYRPADWPGWFVAERLESVAAQFAERADVPAARLAVTGSTADGTSSGNTPDGTSAGATTGHGTGAASSAGPAAGREYRIGLAAAGAAGTADPAARAGTADPAARPGTAGAAGTASAGPRISGPGWLLLAWLIGRSAGGGLAADPPGPLPALPAW